VVRQLQLQLQLAPIAREKKMKEVTLVEFVSSEMPRPHLNMAMLIALFGDQDGCHHPMMWIRSKQFVLT
jgi:hypothetical protein